MLESAQDNPVGCMSWSFYSLGGVPSLHGALIKEAEGARSQEENSRVRFIWRTREIFQTLFLGLLNVDLEIFWKTIYFFMFLRIYCFQIFWDTRMKVKAKNTFRSNCALEKNASCCGHQTCPRWKPRYSCTRSFQSNYFTEKRLNDSSWDLCSPTQIQS